MGKLRELFDSAVRSFANTAGAKVFGWAVLYGGAALALLRSLRVTWWSIVLVAVILAVPIAFYLAERSAHRNTRRRVLFLARRKANASGADGHPDWDRYSRLAVVEVWEAAVMLFEQDPEMFPGAKRGEGVLSNMIEPHRNHLGECLESANAAIGVTLTVIDKQDVDGKKLRSTVRLREFIRWARKAGWKIPTLMAETADLSP